MRCRKVLTVIIVFHSAQGFTEKHRASGALSV